MENQSAKYPITIAGKKLILRFDLSDSPTKQGVRLQFVMSEEPKDVRDKDELKNALSIVLQKRFGSAGIPIDYDERNPYKNVIAYIVPLSSITKLLTDILKGQ